MECGFEREMLAIQMLGYLWGIVVRIRANNKSDLLENISERVRPWTEDKTLDVSVWSSSQIETHSNCSMLPNASLNVRASDSSTEMRHVYPEG